MKVRIKRIPTLGRNYATAFTLLSCLVTWITCDEVYDFIVVGGGTGGCAVARRLAENGKYSVILVESGDVPKEGMDIPAYAPRFVQDPDVTFQYRSVPQGKAAKRSGGVISPVAGRVLGGTSTLSYLWFNRGSPRDYDNWARMVDDPSWKYSNMLEHFKRVETYIGDFHSDQHGYSGPIAVSRPRYVPGLDYWLEAGRNLGYKIADPNGPQQISFGPVEFAKKNGRRVSSFDGYIKPILDFTPNLQIVTNTNATEIIFEGNKAVGIRFQTRSQRLLGFSDNCIYARKEVIISAGNFESPLLLQRSGIGPRDVLQASNIPVRKELPVGKNFHDHVALAIHILINNPSVVMNETRDLTPENLEYLNTFGDGPFSNTRGGGGQAFVASSVAVSEGEGDWGDLHLCMSHSTEPYLSANIFGNSGTVGTDSETPMSSSVFLVRPRSRGSIKINPQDPVNGPPILDVGFYSDPLDLERMLEGVKETIRIFENTWSYRRLAAHVLALEYPECQKFVPRSDDYWRCYIRHTSQSGQHSGGTCTMGRPGDKTTVVDNQLRVLGFEGLRVVDASIMPVQTNANTHAAVYGIAEKAAVMILKYWR